jgi:hypothetical protein
MSPRGSAERPPRLAAWLIDLFIDPRHVEPMVGDLVEEFSTVLHASGRWAARWWCWRQTLRTIPHLLWSSARLAPWSTAGLVLGGLVASTLADSAVWQGARMLLASWNPYDYIPAVWFWRLFDIVRYVALPMALGWMLASLARGREMTVTSLLAAVMVVLFAWNLVVLFDHMQTFTRLRWQAPVVARVMHGGTTVPLAILAGAVLRRRQHLGVMTASRR